MTRANISGKLIGPLAIAGAVATMCAGCASSPTPPRSLATFLLSSGQQPGYTVNGRATIYATVASLISGYGLTGNEETTYEKDLNDAGFELSEGESLSGSGEGFSNVTEFTTAAGAKAWTDDAFRLSKSKQGSATILLFRVPGVGDARAFIARGNPVATANAYWTDGRCSFGSGLYLPNGANETTAEIAAPVIKGIEAQHARTGNACP